MLDVKILRKYPRVNPLGLFTQYLPEISIVLALVGIGFALSLTNWSYVLTLRFIYTLGLPAILAPLFFRHLIRRYVPENNPTNARRLPIRNLVLTYTFFYVASLALLTLYDMRPKVYYFLEALMAATIFLEIMYCDTKRPLIRHIILFQIIALSANSLLSIRLAYPAFVNVDGVAHVYYANELASAGRLVYEMGDYYFTPGYHLVTVMLAQTLGISVYMSNALLIVAAFLMVILALYLLVVKLTGNYLLALLAALLLAMFRYYLYWGTAAMPQSLAFGFSSLLVYLMYRSRERINFRVLTLLVMSFIILTHLLTAGATGVILLTLYIAERVSLAGEKKETKLSPDTIIFFLVAASGYHLLVTNLFERSLSGARTAAMEALLRPARGLASAGGWWQETLENTDLAISLFLVLIAIFFLLSKVKHKFHPLTEVAKLAILLGIFYYPSPLQLIRVFAEPFSLGRWTIYMEIFIAILAALALLLLFHTYRQRRIVILVLFFIMVLMSVSGNYGGLDNPLLSTRVGAGRAYIYDQEETAGVDFMESRITNPGRVVTDGDYYFYSKFVRHQKVELLLYNAAYLGEFEMDINGAILQEAYELYDYFPFRSWINDNYGTNTYIKPTVLDEGTIGWFEGKGRIYDSGNIQFYYIVR